MKRLLLLATLTFTFASFTQAQIASIGDSDYAGVNSASTTMSSIQPERSSIVSTTELTEFKPTMDAYNSRKLNLAQVKKALNGKNLTNSQIESLAKLVSDKALRDEFLLAMRR